MPQPSVTAVVAAAGAGKTTLIVQRIAEVVQKHAPEEIVATTFTVKAADELVERTRAHLMKLGRPEMASRLLGARCGTVNAICGHIAAEYALELGRSPSTEVISEDREAHVFAIAAVEAIGRHADVLNRLAEAFGFDEPTAMGDPADWRATVRDIIRLARANGIAPEALAQSAERSVETFVTLLPPPPDGLTATTLDEDLHHALAVAVAAIPEPYSATARDAVVLLYRAMAEARVHGRPSWLVWARLTKAKYAKTKDGPAFVAAMDEVKRVAARHAHHPQLRRDCEEYIRALFTCAAEALEAYQAYKAERGLLDFIDQETLALQVLQTPELATRLGERISHVFVDEFQDSSPLQVAIFSSLADIADASTWVGDPKQAIYGFRNADSTLTQAVFHAVMTSSSERQEVLSTSHRSRKGIVDFVNAAFEPALTAMGLLPAQHAFSGTSRTDDALPDTPCAVWRLDGGNVQQRAAALAAGILTLLANDAGWLVDDPASGVRPAVAGDIAVLCRLKSEVEKIASALSDVGVKVAVAREGLANTPHVELVMAAVRWTTDPTDRLALAELARYFASDGGSDLWLQSLGAKEPDEALREAVPISSALAALREDLLSLTPSELVDAVITLPPMVRLFAGWGDLASRLDDLEALRGVVRTYEQECASIGAPATASGFVLALSASEAKRPKSLQPDAVKVMTYHGAKGLEWPIVILSGLDSAPRPRLFEPIAEGVGPADWRNPLAGRWIRYWPWPYGSQKKDVGLDQTALDSPLGQLATQRARDEDARLLYVGVTRARDYVVLAPSAAKSDPQWLQVLDGATASRHLVLPVGTEQSIQVGDMAFPARVSRFTADESASPHMRQHTFAGVEHAPILRPSLRRRPSDEHGEASFKVVKRIQLGPRLEVLGDPDMTVLGMAVHDLFAADVSSREPNDRVARANAIFGRWAVHEILAEDVIVAVDRLNAQLRAMWPEARIRREVPVYARLGAQLVTGRIDVLVDDNDGFAVIDHKCFPGARDLWESRATAYGLQLEIYAQAITAATGRVCEMLYVHMPIVGMLLQVAPVHSA